MSTTPGIADRPRHLTLPRKPRHPARILHLPWNVAGQPTGVSRAERELGFVSDVAAMGANPFEYESDIDLTALGQQYELNTALRRRYLWRFIRAYDVFHYYFGRTLFHTLHRGRLRTEIPLLRRLGKTVLATFQGDDARPPSHNPWGPKDPAYLEETRVFQPQRRKLMLDWAHRVFYVNPDLAQWLPGAEFRPYAHRDPRSIEPAPPPQNEEVVVVHAPSDRGIKGTEDIVAAVEALRAEGIRVRLDLVEGIPNAKALRRYAAADVGVDQLNLGWYGGVSVEMMAVGRPVLSRLPDEEQWRTPFWDEIPIVRTGAETLKEDLRALVADPERRRRLGEESRRYVERHHDPHKIAVDNLEGLIEIPRPLDPR